MDLKSAEILESITPQGVERMVRELDEKQTKDFLKGSVDVMELHARLCSVTGFTPREASRLFLRMKPVIVSMVEGLEGLEYVEYPCCASDYICIHDS